MRSGASSFRNNPRNSAEGEPDRSRERIVSKPKGAIRFHFQDELCIVCVWICICLIILIHESLVCIIHLTWLMDLSFYQGASSETLKHLVTSKLSGRRPDIGPKTLVCHQVPLAFALGSWSCNWSSSLAASEYLIDRTHICCSLEKLRHTATNCWKIAQHQHNSTNIDCPKLPTHQYLDPRCTPLSCLGETCCNCEASWTWSSLASRATNILKWFPPEEAPNKLFHNIHLRYQGDTFKVFWMPLLKKCLSMPFLP